MSSTETSAAERIDCLHDMVGALSVELSGLVSEAEVLRAQFLRNRRGPNEHQGAVSATSGDRPCTSNVGSAEMRLRSAANSRVHLKHEDMVQGGPSIEAACAAASAMKATSEDAQRPRLTVARILKQLGQPRNGGAAPVPGCPRCGGALWLQHNHLEGMGPSEGVGGK